MMDRVQAEENIRLIKDIMERSTKYSYFCGLSGIIAGTLALIGCYFTAVIWVSVPAAKQNQWYLLTWVSVLILAIFEDLALAQRRARRGGQTIWVPSTFQALKALLPGAFIAFILSLRALTLYEYDAIPALWALGYGVALCSAGMFSIKELRWFGVVQLITGTIGLFFFSTPIYSLGLVALCFGVYHILYGLLMARKYGW